MDSARRRSQTYVLMKRNGLVHLTPARTGAPSWPSPPWGSRTASRVVVDREAEILDATLHPAGDVGYDRPDDGRRRASRGASKATLYRCWHDKSRLRRGRTSCAAKKSPLDQAHHTLSLRDDLVAPSVERTASAAMVATGDPGSVLTAMDERPRVRMPVPATPPRPRGRRSLRRDLRSAPRARRDPGRASTSTC